MIRHLLLTTAIACFLLQITSCRKIDWKNNHPPANKAKCDYIHASSVSVSDLNDQLLPLFAKQYLPNSDKLEKIRFTFRYVTGGVYAPVTCSVFYSTRRMLLFNELTGDSVATLDFDPGGKLESAAYLEGGFRSYYRFIYGSGNLLEIECKPGFYPFDPADSTWYSYVKLQYDARKKNLSKVIFWEGLAGAEEQEKYMTYEYDYTRKVRGQYYPDEKPDGSFWVLLKYLNIFPELQPENLLTHSFFRNSEYPGDYETYYDHHQLDDTGNLISYKANIIFHPGDDPVPEDWYLSWNCFKKNKQ